jgi:hypothetical protein
MNMTLKKGLLGLTAALAVLAVNPAMAQVEALIGSLTSQLGVTEAQATGGAGAIFALAQDRLAPDEFASLSESVPGVDTLIAEAPGMGSAAEPEAMEDADPAAAEPAAEDADTGALTDAMPEEAAEAGEAAGGLGAMTGEMTGEMPGEMPGGMTGDMTGAMSDMTDAAEAEAGSAMGALGDMAGMGDLGGLAELAGPFSELGMSPDMAAEFVPVILDYVGNTGGSSAMSLLQGALLGG